jgi:single-stranded-DNA-specific exonuclease
MNKRWRVHAHDSGLIQDLQRVTGVPAVVAQLLLTRGIGDPRSAKSFLDTKLADLRDPEDLPGVTQAADLLYEMIQSQQPIVVYGDYDVDGMSATALLYSALSLLQAKASYYIPCRMEEGYGLNGEALTRLASQGARCVVTVDCGIASPEEALLARKLGLKLIVTDHHQFGDTLPEAAAIVHPRLPGHAYPFDGLCGAGVAFKLAWALCRRAAGAKRVGDRMKNFLLEAVALAALGTVADMVPLVDENRVLVRHGLESLKQRPTLGLRHLLKVTDLVNRSHYTGDDISFMLAPRLNAAGRLGQAALAVELLTTHSPQRAAALAEYIHELNATRQTLEQSIYLRANKQAREDFDPQQDPALVLAGRGWHPGVIGIVAGRLAQKYHRPVVVLAQDELGVKPASGSARSVPGFDLHGALNACSEHLERFGGHKAAAGMKVQDDQIDAFRAAFCEFAAEHITDEQRVAELWIDAEAPLSSFTLSVVNQIERLAPFGQGNSMPLLCCSDVTLDESPKRMGGGGRHLSLKISQHGVHMRAVAFGAGDWEQELLQTQTPIEIAYRPVINSFRGRRSVELHLTDWRPMSTDSPLNGSPSNGSESTGSRSSGTEPIGAESNGSAAHGSALKVSASRESGSNGSDSNETEPNGSGGQE